MKPESKQDRALKLFDNLKPEILKLFLGAPEFGSISLTLIFHNGAVTRISHGFEQSLLVADNEHKKRD